jgi:hypothetical protein
MPNKEEYIKAMEVVQAYKDERNSIPIIKPLVIDRDTECWPDESSECLYALMSESKGFIDDLHDTFGQGNIYSRKGRYVREELGRLGLMVLEMIYSNGIHDWIKRKTI